ncbi:hypothetical protein [Mesorhizobium huakuii]|uniref:Uncharacterized protein n=1 Tax=Mesorhizobium huakuii TaxID=28104 RepID=A0A7G6T0W6_9HYPH|nr:hypothetical protein [Mesorhizobium huakuii]QND60398.1 hypothetical protein HB778_30515 [Mesorhizobium huakuii]
MVAVTKATKRQLPTLLVAAILLIGYLVVSTIAEKRLTLCQDYIEMNQN